MALTIDNLGWKAVPSHSWITVNPKTGIGNTNITITTTEGEYGEAETAGTVTITCTDCKPELEKVIEVIRCVKEEPKPCSKPDSPITWLSNIPCEGGSGTIQGKYTAYTDCKIINEVCECTENEKTTSYTYSDVECNSGQERTLDNGVKQNGGCECETPSTCTDPEFSVNECEFDCKVNTLPFDYKNAISFNDCCKIVNVSLSDDTNWEYSTGTTNDKKVIKIRPTSNHIGSVDGNSRSCTVTVSTSCDDYPSETAVTVTQSYCNTGQTCTECICYIVGNATGDANWNDENTTVKWSYTAVTTNSDCTKTSTTGESSQSVTFSKNDACGTVTRTGSFTWTDHKSCDNDNNCTNNDININWSVSQAGKEIKITGGDGITDCNPGTIIFKIEDK